MKNNCDSQSKLVTKDETNMLGNWDSDSNFKLNPDTKFTIPQNPTGTSHI